jgi:hypothetical protein
VFRLHGVPASIVSDRDPRFTSQFFSELCALLGVSQDMSTAFHPQSDGQTERMNRTLEDMLRHYVSPTQTDWNEHLSMVEFAYNNARQESTQETPFFLNYGFHPLSPIDLMLRPVRTPQHGDTPARLPDSRRARRALARDKCDDCKVPAAGRFSANMQEVWERARACLKAAQARQKRYADEKRSDVSFASGDFVLLSTRNLRLKHAGSSKLAPRWVGPFAVKRAVGSAAPVAFELALPPSMGIHPVFHASLLKAYRTPDGHAPVAPPPVEVEGEVEFEVERVLDERFSKRRKEFLVRWMGCDAAHDTWEPASNMTNCPLLMQAWAAHKRVQAGTPPLLGSADRERVPSPVSVDDPLVGRRKMVSVGAIPGAAAAAVPGKRASRRRVAAPTRKRKR